MYRESSAYSRIGLPSPRLPSPHTVAIILRFREEKAEEFERTFEKEVLPLWHKFKAEGKFISAMLSRIVDDHIPEGTRIYLLELEIITHDAHNEFDSNQKFMAFLEKAKPMQTEEPQVWLGKPLFRV